MRQIGHIATNRFTLRSGVIGVVVPLWLGLAIPLAAQSWVTRHGLTSDQYQETFDELRSKGYRLQCVSGYVSEGSVKYAALWTKEGGSAWVAKHGLSPAEYQKAFDDYGKQGLRLTYLNGYEVGGQDYYAAIWEKRAGPPWVARHGLSGSDYQAAFDTYTKQGYRPVFVTGYTHSGAARYAAIFEKSSGPATVARHGLTADQYQQAFTEFSQQGFRLKTVSGYRVGGTDYYAALWEKAEGPLWIARHGIPDSWYQNVFDNYYYQGYRPVFIEAFTSGEGGKVNSVWENTNFKGTDLGLIASKAKAYMDAYNVPGLAFAITKDAVWSTPLGLDTRIRKQGRRSAL